MVSGEIIHLENRFFADRGDLYNEVLLPSSLVTLEKKRSRVVPAKRSFGVKLTPQGNVESIDLVK